MALHGHALKPSTAVQFCATFNYEVTSSTTQELTLQLRSFSLTVLASVALLKIRQPKPRSEPRLNGSTRPIWRGAGGLNRGGNRTGCRFLLKCWEKVCDGIDVKLLLTGVVSAAEEGWCSGFRGQSKGRLAVGGHYGIKPPLFDEHTTEKGRRAESRQLRMSSHPHNERNPITPWKSNL